MYRVTTDPRSQSQLDALPGTGVVAFREVRAMLEVAPWNGEPVGGSDPDAPVRSLVFGASGQGMTTYLVDQRRVDVLDVLWLG